MQRKKPRKIQMYDDIRYAFNLTAGMNRHTETWYSLASQLGSQESPSQRSLESI